MDCDCNACELREARKTITQLQTRMTEMVESQLSRRVRAFHEKFVHPIRWAPTIPPDQEVRFRLSLIAEEFFELLESALVLNESWAQSTKRNVTDAIMCDYPAWQAGVKVDIEAFADALADLAYVIEGTNATFGLPGAAILEEVHRANMAKVSNGTGKPAKPPGWTPPAIGGLLALAGHRG